MMWKTVVVVLAAIFAVSVGLMPGAPQEIDINDEGAKNATDFAVVEHNKVSNDLFVSQVAEVVKIERQVSNDKQPNDL